MGRGGRRPRGRRRCYARGLLPARRSGLLFAQRLHGFQRLADVGFRRHAADGGGDLAVLRDDEGGALGDGVVDLDAARVLVAAADVLDLQVIRLGDLAAGIAGDREFAGAEIRVGREGVQARDAVERHADHGAPAATNFSWLTAKAWAWMLQPSVNADG